MFFCHEYEIMEFSNRLQFFDNFSPLLQVRDVTKMAEKNIPCYFFGSLKPDKAS